MASILEEFAYGNVSPLTQFMERDSGYAHAVKILSDNGQKLWEKLDPDERKLFQVYVEMQSEVNQLTAVKSLVCGFKLGLTMAAEAFAGLDGLYASGNDL